MMLPKIMQFFMNNSSSANTMLSEIYLFLYESWLRGANKLTQNLAKASDKDF